MGAGTILVTSATAAVRGNGGQHAHAAAMGARRMLCQSLNAEFAPRGIHVAHIVIDGSVDAPDTLGRMLGPDRFAALRAEKGGDQDGLLLPAEVAETYLHLHRQHRSAWDARAGPARPIPTGRGGTTDGASGTWGESAGFCCQVPANPAWSG